MRLDFGQVVCDYLLGIADGVGKVRLGKGSSIFDDFK